MSDFIFKAKMYQIQFRLGLRPRPHWGSLERSPIPPSWINGPTSKWWGGESRGIMRVVGVEGRGRDPPTLSRPTVIHISGYALVALQ